MTENQVGRQVNSVGFSFYSAEEIKKLSVKHITNPVLFDTMNHPTPGSLYDPAMGPTDKSSKCTTCSLDYFKCPGHFGYIELASFCYNPINFKLMYKLLGSLCFYCHRFRTSRVQVHHYCAKLTLVRAGLLVEAVQLDSVLDMKFKARKQKNGDKLDDDQMIDNEAKECNEDSSDETNVEEALDLPTTEDEFMSRIDDYVAECMATLKGKRCQFSKTTQITESLRALEREFMRGIPAQSCASCKGQSPKFRKETMIKIFQKGLSDKQRKSMKNKGMVFEQLSVSGGNKNPLELMDMDANLDADVESVQREDDEEGTQIDEKKMRYLTPIEVKEHLVRLWEKERRLLDLLYGNTTNLLQTRASSPEIFFINVLAVPPNKFRPLSKMNDMIYEHPQNIYLTDILKANQVIADLLRQQQVLSSDDVRARNDLLSRMVNYCVILQNNVNNFLDSSGAPLVNGKLAPPGIRQLLEKKEGLFRKHMMGKRVNYAARSVISPDPNIETNEIGIPPVFATKLTYPEPITSFNFDTLRQAVINGPNVWPGATHVESEDGTLINLTMFDEAGRTAVANQLLTPTLTGNANEHHSGSKKVYRHLRNGDFLLLNRQPTLHKPSIMAHTARILPGEKTIRMHYANCNTYNADFDGDEMNIHFPQSALGRAEAMTIARTDLQYLVPTDGGVLRGLIQDHVCAGVDMTSRNTLVCKEEYMRLLYTALRPDSIGSASRSNPNDGNGNIETQIPIGMNGKIITIQPAVIRPVEMWTGKQVISTILLNLTYTNSPLNLISKSKVPAKAWEKAAPEEDTVIVMDGHLLTGILDKSQFGASAHGLVHAVYEIYGPTHAGKLLSILGRLFTCYLQLVGFTCRMDDLRLTPKGDKIRRKMIDGCKGIGTEVGLEYTELDEIAKTTDFKQIKKMLNKRLEKTLRSDERMAGLDSAMKSKTNSVTSSIISACVPGNLMKPFPQNNMQLMTVSGAKGSPVNVSQISCLLGQQELEGRRVPTMISGKTLPCFLPFDTSARSGGYITGRFLTGIRPSEYFFHCMAGREGLIDTAVKTSRSGYLQRCLIKHLEGLRVGYDHSVRDSDGSIVQFHYGEDALDVLKQKTLTKFDFCAMNFRPLVKRYNPKHLQGIVDEESAGKYVKKQRRAAEKNDNASVDFKDPVLSKFSPSRYLGSVSDKFNDQLNGYIKQNTSKLIKSKTEFRKTSWSGNPTHEKSFKSLMQLKYQNSLADPGEAVGLLAAQSIGEPSTQMTLNTFHFAGFGAKNVTLGIPRLREIVMSASNHIKTPVMKLPLKDNVTKEEADVLAKSMTKIILSKVIENVEVEETYKELNQNFVKKMSIKINFWPPEICMEEFSVSTSDISDTLQERFVSQLDMYISRELKNRIKKDDIQVEPEIGTGIKASSFNEGQSSKTKDNEDVSSKATMEVEDLDEDDEVSEHEGDGDTTDVKAAQNQRQKASYDESEEEEVDETEKGVEFADDNVTEEKTKKSSGDCETSATICSRTKFITNYKFDKKTGRTCELELEFPFETRKLLMISIIEAVAKKCVIREVRGLTRAFIMANEAESDKSINLGTEGVNLLGMWNPLIHGGMVDVNRISTNDISATLKTYGVEAARASIVNEVAGVFGVYGISVDSRHLGLIADYMTFEGGYKAFNRIGMNSNPSPLTQMSFETTTAFLTSATLGGDIDTLKSPSARIVLGKLVEGGTGGFDIIHPIKKKTPLQKSKLGC